MNAPALVSELMVNDIEDLDLSMIRRKLADPEEGLGWTSDDCLEVELDYKRYLALKRAYPDRDIVPNQPVDKFWHYHILDTEKYAKDCEAIFGYFLHHYPYFGMNGPDDEQALADAFDDTCALYQHHFGEPYADGRARCRTACKPQKCR
jgi:hypothetical protein